MEACTGIEKEDTFMPSGSTRINYQSWYPSKCLNLVFYRLNDASLRRVPELTGFASRQNSSHRRKF